MNKNSSNSHTDRESNIEKELEKTVSKIEREVKKKVDIKSLKEFEEIYNEIKKLESSPWFIHSPKLASKKYLILTKVLKAMESIVKYSMSFLRLFENHFGIVIDYEIGKITDRDGKPVIYIKLHKILTPDEYNPELTEKIEYERVEEKQE
jgi:hypothetical protein